VPLFNRRGPEYGAAAFLENSFCKKESCAGHCMADVHSSINVVLLPQQQGGAIHVAVENFSIAFGRPTAANIIGKLMSGRDRIEKSLTDNAERPSAQELQVYGGEIASALLSGPVLDLYNSVGAGRVEVAISAEDSQLKRVPWEYLVWPDLRLGPHPKRSIARLVPFTNGTRYVPRNLAGGKLKVVLIGADVFAHDPIPWEETTANLVRVFGERLLANQSAQEVQLDLVEGATRKNLAKALKAKSYDIVHFIGHGRPDGILLRGHTAQKGEVLPTDALNAMISTVAPALVILSACETGKVDDIAPLGNVAESIVASGVPAVVANQMPITVSAIAEFSAALYRALLSTGNIDHAVNMGRVALLVDISKSEAAAVEWGIPILYRPPGCSQLFKL
jgi:hypothetical protein